MQTINIFLADDHRIFRESLTLLVQSQPDFQVVGEVGDGQSAYQQARDCRPDVVIMDISMPVLNGMQATKQLIRGCPQMKIIVLSAHEDVSYVREVLAAGAVGYVFKRSVPEVLIQAIRLVVAGETYLDPALKSTIMHSAMQVASSPTSALADNLNEREVAVLQRIAQGYTYKEVASQLGLSAKTVEAYRVRALEKLGLSGRAALVRYALQRGWLQQP